MKFSVIIFHLLFISNFSNAQEKTITLGTLPGGINELSEYNTIYFKDTNNILDKYVGTWSFENDSIYFKITFYKKERISSLSNKKIFSDKLVSKFQYIDKSIEIYNTNVEDQYISGNSILSENTLSLQYREPSKMNYVRYDNADLTIELIADEIPKLKWIRKNYDICRGTGERPNYDLTEFKIPKKMYLTKK